MVHLGFSSRHYQGAWRQWARLYFHKTGTQRPFYTYITSFVSERSHVGACLLNQCMCRTECIYPPSHKHTHHHHYHTHKKHTRQGAYAAWHENTLDILYTQAPPYQCYHIHEHIICQHTDPHSILTVIDTDSSEGRHPAFAVIILSLYSLTQTFAWFWLCIGDLLNIYLNVLHFNQHSLPKNTLHFQSLDFFACCSVL